MIVSRLGRVLAVVVLAGFAATSVAIAGAAEARPQAARKEGFPSPESRELVRLPGGLVVVYVVGAIAAKSNVDAVAGFLDQEAAALGIAGVALEHTAELELAEGRLKLHRYRQVCDGLSVENSMARVAVAEGSGSRVVFAATRVTGGCENLAPARLEPDAAVRVVRTLAKSGRATDGTSYSWDEFEYSEPTAVVWFFDPTTELTAAPRRAWKFVGELLEPDRRARLTFFVDALTGEVLEARDEIRYADLEGKVRGFATPGTGPDSPSNPPELMPIPDVRITVDRESDVFTDSEGLYRLEDAGPGPWSVSLDIGDPEGSRWVWVRDTSAVPLAASAEVAALSMGDFELNQDRDEALTAQLNVMIHATLAHDLIRERAPAFSALDAPVRANVNLAPNCNAFFDGASINFEREGGGCPNSAYSSVIAHEYGHVVVNRLEHSQEAFGEGFADCLAILLYDDPQFARDFFAVGSPSRDYDRISSSYPCTSTNRYTCGAVLGGVWNEIRKRAKSALGEETGLELARRLFVDWAMLTVGQVGRDAAHPITAVEVLTVDDDDGNLSNGTPNAEIICGAFSSRGIDCPALWIGFPDGAPARLYPGRETVFRVRATPGLNGARPIGGSLRFEIGGGDPEDVPLAAGPDGDYLAVIPAAECSAAVRYSVAVESDAGLVRSPPASTGASYLAGAANGVIEVLSDDFEEESGWTAGAPGDDARAGIWNRMDPEGDEIQPEHDHSPNGTTCWVTDGFRRGGIGGGDVDNGTTTLLSPVFDLSSADDAEISYWRWYHNVYLSDAKDDSFRIDVSDDGGATWINIETIGPVDGNTSGRWHRHRFRLREFAAPTDQVRLRFVASDTGAGSVVEAAVDDVEIRLLECRTVASRPAGRRLAVSGDAVGAGLGAVGLE